MDDTAGKEQVSIHGQYNMDTVVEHDQTSTIHNNRTDLVDVDDSETVGGNQKQHVVKNQTINIDVNRKETVGGTETISITGHRSETVDGGEDVTVNRRADAHRQRRAGDDHLAWRRRTPSVRHARTRRRGGGDHGRRRADGERGRCPDGECRCASDVNVGAASRRRWPLLRSVTVGAAQTTKIAANRSTTVGGDETNSITGGRASASVKMIPFLWGRNSRSKPRT